MDQGKWLRFIADHTLVDRIDTYMGKMENKFSYRNLSNFIRAAVVEKLDRESTE